MIIVLISECQSAVAQMRHMLSQCGHECPAAYVASYAMAREVVAAAHPKPDLILYVVSGPTDRAFASLRELRDATTAQILAIGPRDSSLILGAVRAGAHDYLEQEGDLSVGLSAALLRISNSVRRTSAMGQVTTVISASGGTGSTTVAANLAVALAKTHGRCGLFDFDLRGSDVATYLGLKPRHTVADVSRSIDKLDHKMWEQSLVEHESGVSILAGPESWDDAKYITGEALHKIVRFGRGVLPQIVADLDHFWLSDRAGILLESTRTVLLFRLDFASIRNATRAVQHLQRIGVATDSLHLAVSCYGKHRDISPAQAEAALGAKIRHFIPEDFRIVNASLDCGVPVVLEAPRSPFSRAIMSVADALAQDDAKANGPAIEAPVSAAKTGSLRSFLKLSIREYALRPAQVV
jgi:pilus assembly protein CpaE